MQFLVATINDLEDALLELRQLLELVELFSASA
jgi:hypothetical protein